MTSTSAGPRAGLISTDPQASVLTWLNRVKDPIPAFPFRQVASSAEFKETVDEMQQAGIVRIFVDTPGSLRDEELLLATLEHTDDIVVPLVAEDLALGATARTMKEVFLPSGLPYRLVVNGIDPRDGTNDLEQARKWIDKRGWLRVNTYVRRYKFISHMPGTGMLITRLQPNRNAHNARQDISDLALELGFGHHHGRPLVTAIANQKGGVGKTTIAVQLAAKINEVLGGGS